MRTPVLRAARTTLIPLDAGRVKVCQSEFENVDARAGGEVERGCDGDLSKSKVHAFVNWDLGNTTCFVAHEDDSSPGRSGRV